MFITVASSLLAFLSILLLCGFIVYAGKNSRLHLLYGLFLFSVAVWALGIFGLIVAPDKNSAWIAMRVLNLGFVFIPIFFLHSTLLLLNRKNGNIIKFGYFLTALFFPLSLTGWFTKDLARLAYFYVAVPGAIFPIFLAFLVGFWGYGFYLLLKEIMNKTGDNRNRIMYVFVASIIVLLGGLAVLPSLAGLSVYPVWNITNIIYGSIIAYAITKHELMDIRVAITRAAAYGIVGALLVISFFALNSTHTPILVAMFANSVLGLFWALAAHRARTFIQTPLEEKWVTDYYDSDKLVNTIAQKLVPVLEKEEAFKIIVDELKNIIKIKEIQVIADGEVEVLSDLRDVIAYEALPDEKREKMPKFFKRYVFLPLYSTDSLEAVLAIGPKTSEDPYTGKDITLFRTIMIQAMAILDRIRPYEKIKHDFEANQKKLYEAEAQLERSQRLASLGTLIAGVTHEIRNPIGIIRIQTENLLNKQRDEEYFKQYQKTVMENVDRVEAIIQDMLRMAKDKREAKHTDINLNAAIEKALAFVKMEGVELLKDLTDSPHIQGEEEEIERIFINLFQNAVTAMPGGGKLTIRTYFENNRPVAEVSDTGVGIPPENKEKIFDPFFSTRHEGVGLGLSIAYRIIREHGGNVQFESEVGKGTTFKVTF